MAAPAMPATPAMPAAPAAAPVKQEVAAAPTPQSAADALAAAAVAMQAAASAMKAEQAARPSSPVVAAGAEDAPLEVVQDAPVVPPTELCRRSGGAPSPDLMPRLVKRGEKAPAVRL